MAVKIEIARIDPNAFGDTEENGGRQSGMVTFEVSGLPGTIEFNVAYADEASVDDGILSALAGLALNAAEIAKAANAMKEARERRSR